MDMQNTKFLLAKFGFQLYNVILLLRYHIQSSLFQAIKNYLTC